MCCLQLCKLCSSTCIRYLRPNSSVVGVQTRLESRNCKEDDKMNKCTTDSMEKRPCQAGIKRRDTHSESSPQYAFLMKSMWERPPCCVTCVQAVAPLRHDVTYLKETDYRERRYQRTWPQCAQTCLVEKKCVFEKLDIPDMEKRPRGQKNPDAKWCAKVHECAKAEKYTTPCKPNACKPKGSCIDSRPACCQKRCTLYPSYSECCAKALVERRPNECGCLGPVSLCEVNAWARRMGLVKQE